MAILCDKSSSEQNCDLFYPRKNNNPLVNTSLIMQTNDFSTIVINRIYFRIQDQ